MDEDVVAAGVGVLAQQRQRLKDHARRAVAALKRPGFEERLLERVEPVAFGHSLDGLDLLVLRLCDGSVAGARRPAIDQDGAGTTTALAAAVLAAGQVEVVTQDAEQAAFGV